MHIFFNFDVIPSFYPRFPPIFSVFREKNRREMDETEENTSIDSIEVGPASPHVLVTPRIPIPVMMRETPLSTKRERQAITPRFRRPAPRMIKTVPQTRSIWAVAKDTTPRLVTPHGKEGIVDFKRLETLIL